MVQRAGKGGFFGSGHAVMTSDGLFQWGHEGWRLQMQCGIEEGAGGHRRVQEGTAGCGRVCEDAGGCSGMEEGT